MQEHHTAVVTSCRSPQWPLLPDRNRIDDLRMSTDLSNRISAVRSYAVTKTLAAIANSNDALRVSIPCYIVYSTGDDVVFAWQPSVIKHKAMHRSVLTFCIDAFHCIPDLYCSGDIS
jgi:hypothetical protein